MPRPTLTPETKKQLADVHDCPLGIRTALKDKPTAHKQNIDQLREEEERAIQHGRDPADAIEENPRGTAL